MKRPFLHFLIVGAGCVTGRYSIPLSDRRVQRECVGKVTAAGLRRAAEGVIAEEFCDSGGLVPDQIAVIGGQEHLFST